ncbi:hypothetical protein [Microbispora rosea]|uniref:hypothetical protein n=1 Tax=Microbispora rosea TaxID=58117 RepID=UPI0004C475AB|nr:hypothetical protein [Microbispora rosea]
MTATLREAIATEDAISFFDKLTSDETRDVLMRLLATATPQVLAALRDVKAIRAKAKANLPAPRPATGELPPATEIYRDSEYARERADYDDYDLGEDDF